MTTDWLDELDALEKAYGHGGDSQIGYDMEGLLLDHARDLIDAALDKRKHARELCENNAAWAEAMRKYGKRVTE